MTYQNIRFSEDRGRYRIVLNRPERLNAFTAAMHLEIADALTRIESNAAARVLLLTGEGRAFCAGQDLGERDVNSGPLDLGHALETYYNPMVRRLVALPIPVVCAVNGVAAGAGVNLAAACDIAVARQSAKFAQAFSTIGLIPDAGGSWHLPRRMGETRALAFALLGGTLTADEAQAAGLIFRAIPDDAFEAEVDAIVEKLGSGPTYGHAAAKRLIRGSWGRSLDEALDAERDSQRACGNSADYGEGVNAFKEKRAPAFTGR